MPRVFEHFGVIVVVGQGVDLLRAAALPRALRLTGDEPLQLDDPTAGVTTRAREAWDGKSTSANPVIVGGHVLDGTGIGVAVVDSGADGTHPDLAPALAANKKWVCTTPGLVSTASNTCFGNYFLGQGFFGTPWTGCTNDLWLDLPNTDSTSGHGTHTAGIVAGRGVASDGRFVGAAPGAMLYELGSGEGTSILFALEAFNWVDCNHATVSPPIRVVSNSWGSAGAWDPEDPINAAVTHLVSDDGLVLVFSVGNNGGDGSADQTNTQSKNPTPGVIGVASYNDEHKARRDGSLSTFSSRGLSSALDRNDWPDVSAPGDGIVSTLSKTGPVIAIGILPAYAPYYAAASGTSMSAPHVAGIAALLLQANPALTPADVEDVLEDTALPFTTPGGYLADAGNPTSGVSFGAGHGLVDTMAALQDARVLGGTGLGSRLPQVSQNPHVYVGGLDLQVAQAAPPTVSVPWTVPQSVAVQLSERSLTSGDSSAWPLGTAMHARFRVSGAGSGLPTASVAVDGVNAYQMSAGFTFPGLGDYVIEPQVDFGSGYVSIDRSIVHAV
ncbi:MAG: S8 family serine peptidase [Halobacteriales archaeon]|nr:S8 family serine peptidase [Halobacteriales archaeon]